LSYKLTVEREISSYKLAVEREIAYGYDSVEKETVSHKDAVENKITVSSLYNILVFGIISFSLSFILGMYLISSPLNFSKNIAKAISDFAFNNRKEFFKF
jgi:hypothetical protein